MRKFHSYEEVNPDIHYYVPREELIERAYRSLIGEEPDYDGHYITVWGPRQSGKTWIMRQVVKRLMTLDEAETKSPTETKLPTEIESPFEVAILTMQAGKTAETEAEILTILQQKLNGWFDRALPPLKDWSELEQFFSVENFSKPLILILDEFDSISEDFINKFAHQFRNIYTGRRNEWHKPSGEKRCLLHGLALIGVRSVLGVENVGGGSPFNVQLSLPIPNLTFAEVDYMFHWYERESGQEVAQAVIDRVFYETQGQPGLVGWLGELLTEDRFNKDRAQAITMKQFDQTYLWAVNGLPNSNISNLISQARQEPYRSELLQLFQTEEKFQFRYDDPKQNYLYMNGIVDIEEDLDELYVKFPSPFVQRRLFNAFAGDIFPNVGELYPPFTDLSQVITDDSLNVTNLLRLYERYLQQNRTWLLADAPVRKDLRIYEAVYHFNLYSYLQSFFRRWKGQVYPEFPTGNGQIDLLITYQGKRYGIEVKSFKDDSSYREGMTQSIRYGKRLELKEVVLASFIEQVSDKIRQQYEAPQTDEETGIRILPVFVVTG